MRIEPTIYISLGQRKDIGLDDDHNLIFRSEDMIVTLGIYNQKKIDNLCEYLQRLKIHLPT